MDRKLRKNPEIEQLIRLSASARSSLGHEMSALKHRIDVPSRIRDSLKNHRAGWLLGSLASGLTASMFFQRKPTNEKKSHRGLPLTLLSITFSAVRPFAKAWLTNQVKHYLARTQAGMPIRSQRSNNSSSPKLF
jgi:hypothetical protein